MSKQTFKWRVTSESVAEHNFDVRTVQFGGGYEQRQPKLMRPKLQSWDVKIIGLRHEIDDIKEFLDARGGVESFYWQPKNRERLLVTVSDKYTETPLGGKVYSLSMKFREVLA